MLTKDASTNPPLPLNTVSGSPAIIIRAEMANDFQERRVIRYQESHKKLKNKPKICIFQKIIHKIFLIIMGLKVGKLL